MSAITYSVRCSGCGQALALDRTAARRDAALPRRPFPPEWQLDLDAPLRGRIVYLRRASEHGTASLPGHILTVDPLWPHRAIHAEVDLNSGAIRFFALRRRDPNTQLLLREVPYVLPAAGTHG